jgi:hypothetical protein
MSDKFQSDPARFNEAVASMESLGDLINEFGEKFVQGLSGSAKILGSDQFGLTADRQLQSWTMQLGDAVNALSQVADGVPQALRVQQQHVKMAQTQVGDAIDGVGAYQSEGVPGKGGVSGR